MAIHESGPAAASGVKKKGVYEVRLPNTEYSGDANGVTFEKGVGHTDDGKRAHACLELGAKVTKDGKEWPKKEQPAQDPSKPAK